MTPDTFKLKPAQATDGKRGKHNQLIIGLGFSPDWLKIKHLQSDWPELVIACITGSQ